MQIAFSKFASFPFRRRFVLLRLSKKPMSAPPAPGGAAATASNLTDTITLSIRTLAPATHIVSVSSTVSNFCFSLSREQIPIDLPVRLLRFELRLLLPGASPRFFPLQTVHSFVRTLPHLIEQREGEEGEEEERRRRRRRKKEERKRGQEKEDDWTRSLAPSPPAAVPLSSLSTFSALSLPLFRRSLSMQTTGNRRRAQAAPRRAHGRPRRHAAPHLPRAGARAGRLGDARVPRRRRRAYAAPGHALAGDGRRRRRRRRRRRPPRRSLLPPARVLRARGLRGRRCCSRRRRRIRRSFCRAPTAGQRRDAGRGL